MLETSPEQLLPHDTNERKTMKNETITELLTRAAKLTALLTDQYQSLDTGSIGETAEKLNRAVEAATKYLIATTERRTNRIRKEMTDDPRMKRLWASSQGASTRAESKYMEKADNVLDTLKFLDVNRMPRNRTYFWD